MASLPPYSTYRTDAKQMMFPQATSHGNILTFRPPGFSQELNVKFPDSRLAVCEKCKKNFKTRDMCRVRNTHTAAPWTTAYICITIDDTCVDENGKFIDKPMTVRMVQWQPYCVKKPFDSKTPVCSSCKRTNRTRGFCRDRHKHRQLPWCTVYVILTALESTDPNTIVAGPSKKVKKEGDDGSESSKGKPGADEGKKPAEDASANGSDTIASDPGDEGDNINDIAESRTFLAKVSYKGTTIHWLDLAEFDNNEGAAPFPTPTIESVPFHPMPPGMDPNHPPPPPGYYASPMGYAQQHQNALKSRQQYFFQMHHQQHYPQQPGHWQPQHYASPPSETGPSGTTAGEAAAQHRRSHQMSHDETQQHWAMYYHPGPYGYGVEGGPHTPGAQPNSEANNEAYHTPPDSANGETEEHDSKRQRVA